MADSTARLTRTNDFIEPRIKEFAEEIEKHLDGDLLAYNGDMVPNADELIRDALESRPTKREKLIFVLETSGGLLDTVIRIVDTTRHHYPKCVEFIVPNYAYSAGTVLALSGDEIYMDYFSVLGPTDPQVQDVNGLYIPAWGYVERYDELLKKGNDPNQGLSTAEITLLVSGFDPGRIQMYKHQRELSKTLLQEWLPKYKFQKWTETETRKLAVDDDMRAKRACEIADILSSTDRWHSHGRGINMSILQRDVKLIIKDFGADEQLNNSIRQFNGLINDYVARNGTSSYMYTPGRLIV